LHTNSFDEALALPSEHAVKIALRTQQIIAHESGVANTIDPLGGSYYMEWLTSKMEEEAETYFKKINDLGGVIPAIKKNFFQMEIARSAYEYQKQVESGDQNIVAVNFQRGSSCGPKVDLLKIGPEVAEKQIAELAKLKATRDNKAVAVALDNVRAAAKGTSNLVYPILDAVKAYASVGEIIATLKEVFGVHKEDAVF
jgi:methylmalonyl-CoA mutase N-terminal domain/subunit